MIKIYSNWIEEFGHRGLRLGETEANHEAQYERAENGDEGVGGTV